MMIRRIPASTSDTTASSRWPEGHQGRPDPRRLAQRAVRARERQVRYFPGDGDSPLEGVRRQPEVWLRMQTELRPVAGPAEGRPDQD